MQEAVRYTPENPMQGKEVAIVGGGPAGSTLGRLLARNGVHVTIFEPRSIRKPDLESGGKIDLCEGCAAIVQKNVITSLEEDGLTIPEEVVQTHLQGSTVHYPSESETTFFPADGSITVYRGFGPIRQKRNRNILSLDAYLLAKAIEQGAENIQHIQTRIVQIDLRGRDGKVHLKAADGKEYQADMIIGAYGHDRKLKENIFYPKENEVPLPSPKTQKAGVREYYIGREKVKELLQDQIHVFGNPTKSVWFAAAVPKKEYITIVLMGRDNDIRDQDFEEFLANQHVSELLPNIDGKLQLSCACKSLITLKSPERFMVRGQNKNCVYLEIGDSGAVTPRKNGLYSAIDSARHLAQALIKNGNSIAGLEEFRRYINRTYVQDNFWSEAVLKFSDLILNHSIPRKAVIFSANHNIPLLSKAVRSTMSHILTGRDSYWRIPANVFREVLQ